MEEREKGFEPSTLALARHEEDDRIGPHPSKSARFLGDGKLEDRKRPQETAFGRAIPDGKPDGFRLIPLACPGFFVVARALDTTPEHVAELVAAGALKLLGGRRGVD